MHQFPIYLAEVMGVIGNGEWLVHNFNVEADSEALNPANYLYNTQFNGNSYTAYVDLNAFQFLVNSIKKDESKNLYRIAVAYLVFFQAAGIEVDPTYAMYEKVNRQQLRAREGIEDLEFFYQLNNMPMDQLAMYAIGRSNQLILDKRLDLADVAHVEAGLTRYHSLKGWPSLYAIVLAVVKIEFDSAIPRQQKLGAFIEWSFRVFRHSLPGFVFAVSVLGHQKLGRTMKYDPLKPVDKRRAALGNMTWDLYYIWQYSQRWVNRAAGEETLFLTNDKAFAQILSFSIDIQRAQSLQPVKQYISGFDQQLLAYVMQPESYPYDRAYKSDRWGIEYRDEIIAKLEGELLNPET